ncbi:DNL-type zinc finger protein-like [Osmia bicornis bicornis]|uniref:DNL-type zinc finger protein-like n=1 Tax=Osmia bicornis bicornis TaxID=1437191 RepID=UPI001EAF5688|nr:DNL-type zinc finger protein-like [Osmia bicornis bicornis]
MYCLRQAFRYGTRLILTKNPTNLYRLPLINEERFKINFHERIHIRSKTSLCESAEENKEEAGNKQVLGKIEGKLKVMFTCKICQLRSGKVISKVAYERGVVIIRCDGCKNNHLIADNLGWFEELQKNNNIEKILAAKGETVRKILNDTDGYVEVIEKAEYDLLQHNIKRKQDLIKQQNKIDSHDNKNPGTLEEK